MSLIIPKTCSMGGSQTGLAGTIGVTLLNPDGTTHTARATAGIYEIGGGCYGKNLTFPDDWKGSLKWDTGSGSPVYATEDYAEGLIDEVGTAITDIKGTGFAKDTDSLVNIRPETDKIQTGIIDAPGDYKADVSGVATNETLIKQCLALVGKNNRLKDVTRDNVGNMTAGTVVGYANAADADNDANAIITLAVTGDISDGRLSGALQKEA